MIIKITPDPASPGAPEEFVILELQGQVLPTLAQQNEDGGAVSASAPAKPGVSGRMPGAGVVDPNATLDGLIIGQLTMRPDGKGQLQVGNHRVTGEVETLPKPLVLIDKRQSVDDDGRPIAHEPSDLYGPEYIIKAVIRKRLKFELRPQPIVGAATKR